MDAEFSVAGPVEGIKGFAGEAETEGADSIIL